MNYPTVVRFCGMDYRVKLTDKPIEHEDYPGKKYHGVCIGEDKEIWLYNNRGSPDSTCETFFHELIEAANGEFDMALPHQSIKTLGMMMHQIFKEYGPYMLSGGTAPTSTQ